MIVLFPLFFLKRMFSFLMIVLKFDSFCSSFLSFRLTSGYLIIKIDLGVVLSIYFSLFLIIYFSLFLINLFIIVVFCFFILFKLSLTLTNDLELEFFVPVSFLYKNIIISPAAKRGQHV